MITNVASVERLNDAFYLAWKDFTVPYRRTLVGPLWEILGAVLWIAGLSAVFYSPMSFESRAEFISFVACGVVTYNFIASTISSSPTLFVSQSSIVLNLRISPFFLIQRRAMTNGLRFGAQLVAAVLSVIFFGPGLSVEALMVIPGIIMAMLAAVWVTTILSLWGARHHDLAHLATFASRLMLFLSPVFWSPGSSEFRAQLALYNPITHYLDLVRGPLLQEAYQPTAWAVVLLLNLVGCIAALWVYRQSRPQLMNWI